MTTADERRLLLEHQREHLQKLVDEVDAARAQFAREDAGQGEQDEVNAGPRPHGDDCRCSDPFRKIKVDIEHPMAEKIGGPLGKIIGLMFYNLVDAAGNYVAERELAKHVDTAAQTEETSQKFAAEIRLLRRQLGAAEEKARTLAGRVEVEVATVNQLRDELTGGRELWEKQRQVIDERGQEIIRLNRRLDEAFALVREQEKKLEAAGAPAAVIEEVTECPEGSPGACTSPSSHPLLTDTWAVPRCLKNRHDQAEASGEKEPADLCVSEHCERCNAYRREMGLEELVPNGWLRELGSSPDTAARVTMLPELAGRAGFAPAPALQVVSPYFTNSRDIEPLPRPVGAPEAPATE